MIDPFDFVIEFAGGSLSGSVASLGDAVHRPFDASAYVVALDAAVIARRSNSSGRRSCGSHRVEPFWAFSSGVLLVPLVVCLVVGPYHRWRSPAEVDARMTFLSAAGDVLVTHSPGRGSVPCLYPWLVYGRA